MSCKNLKHTNYTCSENYCLKTTKGCRNLLIFVFWGIAGIIIILTLLGYGYVHHQLRDAPQTAPGILVHEDGMSSTCSVYSVYNECQGNESSGDTSSIIPIADCESATGCAGTNINYVNNILDYAFLWFGHLICK